MKASVGIQSPPGLTRIATTAEESTKGSKRQELSKIKLGQDVQAR